MSGRVKQPISINNMRAFSVLSAAKITIALALISCASASCITRQSTTYYTPSVSQSSSDSSSSSYTPYNNYYGGYGYGGYGGYGYGYSAPVYSYVEESDSSSTTYSVDPVVTEYVYEDDCVEDEDPISYSMTSSTSENSSSSESSDSSETYSYEESTDYVDDDCVYRYRRSIKR